MKVSKSEVQRFLKFNPEFNHRSKMYEGTCFYVTRALGPVYTAEHVQMGCIVHRRMQAILPPDAKGTTLQKQWLSDEGMKDIVSFAEEALNGRRVIERNGNRYYLPKS